MTFSAAQARAGAAKTGYRLATGYDLVKMRTVILDEPGHFRLTDTTAPAPPGSGEVLVRVLIVGICGTDLHAFEGTQPFFSYPRILGHELAVEVIETGDGVDGFKPATSAPSIHT